MHLSQYSFEQRPMGGHDDWVMSSKRWDYIHQAAEAAAKWTVASFENDFPVEVRLVQID